MISVWNIWIMYRSIRQHCIPKKPGRRFLISESVRGEGAVLYNKDKERFVNELLPRDVVTKAIREQMEKDGTQIMYGFLWSIFTNETILKAFSEYL